MKEVLKESVFSVSIDEIRKHPEIILSLLKKHREVSLSVDSNRLDSVNVVTAKNYDERVTGLVKRAKLKAHRKKGESTREQVVENFKKSAAEGGAARDNGRCESRAGMVR